MCLIVTATGIKQFPDTSVRNIDGNPIAPKTAERLAIEWEREAKACESNGMDYHMGPACFKLAEEFRACM